MFLKSTDLKIMLQYLQESSLSGAVFLIWKCAPQKCFLDNVRYVQASYFKSISYKCLTLFKMGLFGAAHGWGAKKAPLPKICHTYPAIMKLGTVIPYLKKTQKKYMNHVTHSLSPADISIFSSKISKFCYIRKYSYRLHFGT